MQNEQEILVSENCKKWIIIFNRTWESAYRIKSELWVIASENRKIQKWKSTDGKKIFSNKDHNVFLTFTFCWNSF